MVSLISNPVSGKFNIDKKFELLTPIAKHFKSEIYGLDTISKTEFKNCLKDLSKKDNEICVAGGDGTLLDVLNTVDKNIIISYIPMGSGNAIKKSFYSPQISKKFYDNIFNKIINGKINYVDTINCNGIYSFLAGIGLDALVAFKREEMIKNGIHGFKSYSKAFFNVFKQGFSKYPTEISLDNCCLKTEISTLIASKTTHYGYNLQVMPEANINDSFIHIRTLPPSSFEIAKGLVSGFLQNQIAGTHYLSHSLKIKTKLPIYIHLHGTPFQPTNEINMNIEPKSFKFRY
jgi:diacylglycerol kinase family enzyme